MALTPGSAMTPCSTRTVKLFINLFSLAINIGIFRYCRGSTKNLVTFVFVRSSIPKPIESEWYDGHTVTHVSTVTQVILTNY